jgi:hypothetical protein
MEMTIAPLAWPALATGIPVFLHDPVQAVVAGMGEKQRRRPLDGWARP